MDKICRDWKSNSKDEEIDQYDYLDEEVKEKIISKYAHIIGAFLISFNNLEHELNRTISIYFHDDLVHEGYLITKDLMFRNRIELFNNLISAKVCFSKKKVEGIKKLKSLYSDLNEINVFRNCVIHANWLTLDKEWYVRTKIDLDNNGGFVKGKKVKITTTLLRAQMKNIDSLINRLFYFEDFNFFD